MSVLYDLLSILFPGWNFKKVFESVNKGFAFHNCVSSYIMSWLKAKQVLVLPITAVKE